MVNVTVGQSFHWSTVRMGCSEILSQRASRGHLWSFVLALNMDSGLHLKCNFLHIFWWILMKLGHSDHQVEVFKKLRSMVI